MNPMVLLLAHASFATTIDLEGAATAGPSNSIPFGGPSTTCSVTAAYSGFVYKNVPAFDLLAGDTIAFDLGLANDVDIEVNIALATAVSNGSYDDDSAGFTQVVTAGTPSSPKGNATKGDFELEFTTDAPYSFAGGGLLIRFESTGAYVADTNCTQVLMYANGTDSSGYFVGRFYNDSDGNYPWGSSGLSYGADYVGEVRITYSDGTPWYADADGDGYGYAGDMVVSLTQPAGYVADDTDCIDSDANISPAAIELCDGQDDDCDGEIDENDALDASTWYADLDEDTYGDPDNTTVSCLEPEGYVAIDTDCDDDVAAVNPSADESCNGYDDDCDGLDDEDDAIDALVWTVDDDADGFGAEGGATTTACEEPAGYAFDAGDCDDARDESWPGADEYCNGYDDDCDGTVDEPESLDASTWYADSDGDSYGDASVTTPACGQPAGYVADTQDCDDGAATVSPVGIEMCNGVDDDCDDRLDEDDAVDAATWYADVDGDGFGDESAHRTACSEPEGYGANAGDCDDRDAESNPDAEEVWYDGVDQDCDGNDVDQDADGSPYGEDCDDEDAARSPDFDESWYDGVDADCAGDSDFDQDGDGQDSETNGGPDCDDANPTIYEGAVDDPYDGLITDCANANEYDADADGYRSDNFDGDDCDDANSDIHPGADDTADNGVDEDCDGEDTVTPPDGGEGDTADDAGKAGDCGCASGGAGAWWWSALVPIAALRRRRGQAGR